MKIFVATLLVSLAATPAYAAELGGGRIELRGGYESVDLDAHFDDGSGRIEGESNEGGFTLGAEAGYDFMATPSFLIGLYAGVDFGSADFCQPVLGNDEACLEANRNWTLGARAGVPVGEAGLLYVKGGYSNGKLTAKYEDFDNIIADLDESESRSGMHIGAGGELAFGPNLYGKAEYVYTNYSNADFGGPGFTAGLNVSRHQGLLGVGLRF